MSAAGVAVLRDVAVSLAYPPMLSLSLLALAGALWLVRRRPAGTALAAAALAWSAVWSLPWASESLRGLLEQRYPVVGEAARLPRACRARTPSWCWAAAATTAGWNGRTWLRRNWPTAGWPPVRAHGRRAGRRW